MLSHQWRSKTSFQIDEKRQGVNGVNGDPTNYVMTMLSPFFSFFCSRTVSDVALLISCRDRLYSTNNEIGILIIIIITLKSSVNIKTPSSQILLYHLIYCMCLLLNQKINTCTFRFLGLHFITITSVPVYQILPSAETRLTSNHSY